MFILFLLSWSFRSLLVLLALKLLQCVYFVLGCAVLSLGLLTALLVPRGVLYFLVTMSFEVVVLVGGFLDAQFGGLPV